MLQAQSRFGEDMLREVFPGLGVLDLALKYVYDSLFRGITYGAHNGGGVLKPLLLSRYWLLGACHVTS